MSKIEIKNKLITKSLKYIDNKDYVFVDCEFRNDVPSELLLLFKSDYVTFIRCSFGGKVAIQNKGVGVIDDIYMENIKTLDNKSKNRLSVRSTSLFFAKSNLNLDLNVVADEVELYKVKNESSNINVTFYKKCTIEDSVLNNVLLLSNDQEKVIKIRNTSINDSYVSELVGLTDMQEAGKKLGYK